MKAHDAVQARARELLEQGALARVLAGQVKLCGEYLADPSLDARRRKEYERRLVAAYGAIVPRKWTEWVAKGAIVDWLKQCVSQEKRAAELICIVKPEEQALEKRAQRLIASVMNDEQAPEQWHGRQPTLEAVKRCLDTMKRGPGAPRATAVDGSKHAAVSALFRELGFRSNSGEAVKKLLQRRPRRKK